MKIYAVTSVRSEKEQLSTYLFKDKIEAYEWACKCAEVIMIFENIHCEELGGEEYKYFCEYLENIRNKDYEGALSIYDDWYDKHKFKYYSDVIIREENIID